MIAHRYVPAICLLLLLALIPTIIHSYSPSPSADRLVVEETAAKLPGYTSVPSDRAPGWGKRRFDTDDWVEREFRHASGGASVRLTIVRTFDVTSIYHHPELAITDGTSFVGEEIRRLPSHPDVPLHVLKPGPGVSAFAAYALSYDTRLIDDPIMFQIRAAGEMLFSRRKPMTLFFAFVPNGRQRQATDADQSTALTLLLDAVEAFSKTPQ